MEKKIKIITKFFTKDGIEIKPNTFCHIENKDFTLIGKVSFEQLKAYADMGFIVMKVYKHDVKTGSDTDIDKNVKDNQVPSEEGKNVETKNNPNDLSKDQIELSKIIRKAFISKEDHVAYSLIIDSIAIKHHIKGEKVHHILERLYDISPIAVFNVLFNEAAFMLDINYPDHIKDAKVLYSFSPARKFIYPVHVDNKLYYKNVALFRSIADVKLALYALRDIVKEVFGFKPTLSDGE
jgi:hypothetical protein